MMSSTVEDPIPAEKEKLLRGIIQPETVIDRLAEGTSGDQLTIFRPGTGDDDVIRVMDRQQEAMAKSLGEGHRVIRGVAGSGKTLILLYRARLLGKLYPHFNFLLTCYTRSLAGQLRALLVGYSNVEVIHLDKLMFDTIRAGGLKHPGYKDNNSGDRVAQVALQALQRGAGSRYHAILLDEAQDFSTDALKFALGLLEPGRDDVVIVADAAQNIFRRKFSWKQAGIQAQGRSRILRVNYRNTREILEFASTFLLASRILRPDEVPDPEDENTVIPPESSMRSGPQPTVEVVRDVRGEVQASVKIVREWLRRSPAPRSIGVLYPGSIDSGIDRGNGIWDSLKNSGCEAFWLSDPRDSKSKDRLADVKSPIIVSTVHSAKGLEFPYVVLCGLWRDNVDGEDNRRVAYVGMTRATEFLAVVSREGNPLIDDLKMAASRTTGSPA
jgi:superfamily I DNA/RNA helicase